MKLRARAGLLALATIAGAARTSAEEPRPRADRGREESGASAEAARLKSAADVLMDQDRYADAVALYARAYELSSDPALLYNQGRALEAMGEYPDALDKLEQFERTAPPALRARVPALRELISDLRGRIATVIVRSNARGARVLVRDKAAGTVNGELRVRTRAGPAAVEVTAEGYEPFHRDVELSSGGTYVVEALLTPRVRDGVLVVRTRPPCDVTVDGRGFGRAPVESRLTPGPHEVRTRAEGFREERFTVVLHVGERREVDVELRRPPTLTSRWWFWTAAGLVVAGGAAAAVALSVERPPSSGSFANGRIEAP